MHLHHDIPWWRRFGALLTITLAAIAVGDLLLAGSSPGWTASLALLLAGTLPLLRRPQILADSTGIGATAAIVLAAGAWTVEPGPLALLVGAAGMLVLARVGRGGGQDALQSLRDARDLVASSLRRLGGDLRLLRRVQLRHPGASLFTVLGRWLRRLLPALLIAGIFLILFAIANPVLERWSDRSIDWLDQHLVLPGWSRLFLWAATAVLAWWALRGRLGRRRRRTDAPSLREGGDRTPAVRNVLIACILAFAVEAGLDIAYLWAGAGLPAGMTWAGYAHRGAYPLLAAALIAAVVILVAFRRSSSAEGDRAARILLAVFLALILALLVGALRRLQLYTDIYALSLWRCAAAVWMLLVGLGVLLIGWRIYTHRSNLALINANAVMAAAVLLVCAWIDWAGLVARHNVDHCREVGGTAVAIDLAYLADLGHAAVPALIDLSRRSDDPHIAHRARSLALSLHADLANRLTDVRAWTWVRGRALAAVDAPTR